MNAYAKHKNFIVPIVWTLVFISVILVNSLSSSINADNKSVGEITYNLPSAFTPAGYAFGIWGLIFFMTAVLIVWSWVPRARGDPWIVNRLGLPFALAWLLSVIWVIVYQREHVTASIIPMVLLLLSLIFVYVRTGVNYRPAHWTRQIVGDDGQLQTSSKITLAIAQPTVSLWLGWISVATIANVALAILADNIDTLPTEATAVTWSIVMQVAAAVLALLMIRLHADFIYGAVISWALFAIYHQHIQKLPMVGAVAAALGALIAIAALFTIIEIVVLRLQIWRCGRTEEARPLAIKRRSRHGRRARSPHSRHKSAPESGEKAGDAADAHYGAAAQWA